MSQFAIIIWSGIAGQLLAYSVFLLRLWLAASDKQRIWLGVQLPGHIILGFMFGLIIGSALIERFRKQQTPSPTK